MNHKIKLIGLSILTAGLLAGCESKNDVSESNFAEAINKFFQEEGKGFCMPLGLSIPIEVPYSEFQKNEKDKYVKVKRLEYLERAGILQSEDTLDGKNKMKNFTLTEKSKPFLQELPNGFRKKQTAFCWGRGSVDKIIKWESPSNNSESKETYVYSTFKINFEDWVTEELKEKDPAILDFLKEEGKKELKFHLKLMNIGWEAKASD